jgi:hypothetical protein
MADPKGIVSLAQIAAPAAPAGAVSFVQVETTAVGVVPFVGLSAPEVPAGVVSLAQASAPEAPAGVVSRAAASAAEAPAGIVSWALATSVDKRVVRTAHGTLYAAAAVIEFAARGYGFALTNLDGSNQLWFRFDDQSEKDIAAGEDECGVVLPGETREFALTRATRSGHRFLQLVSDGGGDFHVEMVR